MWYDKKMDYCSVLEKKEVLPLATTWMSPQDTMLSEICQSQKEKSCMIPRYEAARVVKFIVRGGMLVPWGWGRGMGVGV